MKAFAVWMMKGRMQAVIAATVLAMLGLLVTPLALASAAVITLTVLRQGWFEGLLVLASSLLALTGLGGLVLQMPIAILLVGLALWVPAAVLGGVLGRTGSLRIGIEFAVFMAGALVLLQYLLFADPAAFWSDALNAFLSQRLDTETLSNADVAQLIELMSGWMVGGVAATWLLGVILSMSLARYWASQIANPGDFGREFRDLRFGRWLLIVVPILLVTGILMTGGKPTMMGQLYLVGMVVFLVQGISVVHGLVAAFSASAIWLAAFYMLLLFIAPQGATAVALAGYADGWLNFRARARARRSGNDRG